MNVSRFAMAAGRALLASLFVIAGLMFFRKPDFAFAESVIAAHGLPFAWLLLIGTMILQLAGGLMILVNWHTRWAAGALFVWLIPATLMFHPFWSAPPEQVADQTFHFLKNLGLAGALLLVAATAEPHPLVQARSSQVSA
jgi:putative oxidoreductase